MERVAERVEDEAAGAEVEAGVDVFLLQVSGAGCGLKVIPFRIRRQIRSLKNRCSRRRQMPCNQS